MNAVVVVAAVVVAAAAVVFLQIASQFVLSFCTVKSENIGTYVVYFDQHLGAAHSKHWSK